MEVRWEIIIWLLPLTGFIGWLWGRYSAGVVNGPQKNVHPEYLKGLNYVLNEQPDKAIEVFIRMLEVDSETIETHLALGNLFRRRGEVDRAIRIHQNLIARPNLSDEQRSISLLELGMDYMRSGLLDRAESLFIELVASGRHLKEAYDELLEIYQQEHDWIKAIETAKNLEYVNGSRLNHVIAQFYCEIAEEKIAQGLDKEVRNNLHNAISIDPKCVRAILMEAELLTRAGKIKQAIKAYKKIENQSPDFIPEIIVPLLKCYREIDKVDEYMNHLFEIVNKHGGITPMLMLTKLIAEFRGEDAAAEFITNELNKHPDKG